MLEFRKIVPGDLDLLRALNCPLRHALSGEADLSPMEEIELLFLFSIPHGKAAKLLRFGRQAYRDAALNSIGFVLSPGEAMVQTAQLLRERLIPFVKAYCKEPNDSKAERVIQGLFGTNKPQIS